MGKAVIIIDVSFISLRERLTWTQQDWLLIGLIRLEVELRESPSHIDPPRFSFLKAFWYEILRLALIGVLTDLNCFRAHGSYLAYWCQLESTLVFRFCKVSLALLTLLVMSLYFFLFQSFSSFFNHFRFLHTLYIGTPVTFLFKILSTMGRNWSSSAQN
jgi:hypothetical protein